MSAVLAGYCLFRFYAQTSGNHLVLPYLMAAGALLGMADNAWRAIFTAAADTSGAAKDLPSSAVSTTAAYFIAVFTSLAGLMCAMTGGYNSFRAGAAMILLTLIGSALFRNVEIISPILKGLSAGMLFVIGMTPHSNFIEMLEISETRIPAAFFAIYMVVASVLAQVRDSAKPREAPVEEELSGETASRLLKMRDEAVDRAVVWFGGAALVLIPLALALVMPSRWLSWCILVALSLSTLLRLIPVLAYGTRKDLADLVEAVYRGGALLNAGSVASLGGYHLTQPIFAGWEISLPEHIQLVAVAAIALLAAPAWLLRRVAPLDDE